MENDNEDSRDLGLRQGERDAAREITGAYPDTLAVFGELTSIARRFRLRQLELLIDQERAVVEAHRNYMAAQEAWQVAAERLKPENLREIKQAEVLKVRAERAEQEFRLAEAKRKIATFERRSRIHDIVLDAEEEEARLRLERARKAREALSNPPPEPEPEPEPDLEDELMKVVQELSGLEQELNELRSRGASEAEISVVEFKISACLRRKAALEEKLAGI